MAVLPGAEPLTKLRGAQTGGWTPTPRNPEPEAQQESLPLTGEKGPPHHSLSPHQFAAQHDVWWHGRYGDDLPSDSFKEGYDHFPDSETSYNDDDDEEYDDKSGYQGLHFGTRKSAEIRLNHLGPGRAQSEGEAEEMERTGQPERIPGRLFPVTLNHERFASPEYDPTIHQDVGHDWRPHMGYDEPESKGVLYKNDVEDYGSISAAVPERSGRQGAFFKTWNDHVTEAHDAGADVHPMLLHAARRGAEHTGEDYVHPDEVKSQPAPQSPLFHTYGSGHGVKAKYLDTHHKNTLGPNIKVPSQTIKRKEY